MNGCAGWAGVGVVGAGTCRGAVLDIIKNKECAWVWNDEQRWVRPFKSEVETRVPPSPREECEKQSKQRFGRVPLPIEDLRIGGLVVDLGFFAFKKAHASLFSFFFCEAETHSTSLPISRTYTKTIIP